MPCFFIYTMFWRFMMVHIDQGINFNCLTVFRCMENAKIHLSTLHSQTFLTASSFSPLNTVLPYYKKKDILHCYTELKVNLIEKLPVLFCSLVA